MESQLLDGQSDAEKFGFNKSSMAQYVKDTLISFVMTIVLGSLIVWGIYAIISNFVLWWLWRDCTKTSYS